MAGRRQWADTAQQMRAMLKMLEVRVRAAERSLGETRNALHEAQSYHAICQSDHDAEKARLQAIIKHLGMVEVSNSPSRYADMLATRDIVARDLGRERFMFDNADTALHAAREAHDERQACLVRLRARAEALRKRLANLQIAHKARLELVAENEAEELASMHHARSAGRRS